MPTRVLKLMVAVSPVVLGLALFVLYGRTGWLGPWLSDHDIKVIFVLTSAILEDAGFALKCTITKPAFRTSETCHVAAL